MPKAQLIVAEPLLAWMKRSSIPQTKPAKTNSLKQMKSYSTEIKKFNPKTIIMYSNQ